MQKTSVVPRQKSPATELRCRSSTASVTVKRLPCSRICSSVRPLDEFHPQADLVSDSLGAVDGHDVRVANSRQQAAFFDDRACATFCLKAPSAGKEFERDVAIEPGLEGTIDLSEGAATNRFD